MQSQTSQSERVIGTILAVLLVLFASIAAPKLPKSIVKHLENPLIRLIIFISIGYLATKDLITAIIAVIAVLVSYQTLSVHKLTDKMIKKTNDVINENISVSSGPFEGKNNNELRGVLFIIPTKSAEKIILDFKLLPSGAEFEGV